MPQNKDPIVSSENRKQKKPTQVARKARAITDCKQTLDELRASEDKVKYMFDHSPVGRSITLPSGEINVARDITEFKQAEEALRQKMNELERFQRLLVGRELRMIEMKKEIYALLVQSGQPEKYPLPLESDSVRSQ
jgi:hypothetical protein